MKNWDLLLSKVSSALVLMLATTFVFAAYTHDAEAKTNKRRTKNHEMLLSYKELKALPFSEQEKYITSVRKKLALISKIVANNNPRNFTQNWILDLLIYRFNWS